MEDFSSAALGEGSSFQEFQQNLRRLDDEVLSKFTRLMVYPCYNCLLSFQLGPFHFGLVGINCLFDINVID